jgi:hypothetical protein
MHWPHLLPWVLLAAASVAAAGPDPDPLRSPQCGIARAELEAALDAAGRKLPGAAERLPQVRARAVETCLGASVPPASAQQRSGAPERPIAVVPTHIGPRAVTPQPTLEPAPPPVAVPRPATITTCDPGGCWDTEGRRLNNMAPLIVGPRGACTLQGSVVVCP